MMYKRLGVIAFCIVIMVLGAPFKKAFSETFNKILIVYDAPNIYGDNQNILNTVNTIALESKKEVKVESLKEMKDRAKDSKVIFINCNEKFLSSEQIKILNSENIVYISNLEIEGLKTQKQITITELMKNYIESRNKLLELITNGKIENRRYLVIQNVNPFIDLNTLVDKITYLKEQGIPFILDTIPVYINSDQLAMKRFCEVLRYAEASGGYIMLSNPYINNEDVTSEDVFSKMIDGYKNYIGYSVYPMGMTLPASVLYEKGANKYLSKTNTLFVRDSKELGLNLGELQVGKIENIIQEIDYSKWKGLNYENFYGSVGIGVKDDLTLKEFKQIMEELSSANIYFNSPSGLNSEINMAGSKVTVNPQGIYLNGKDVTVTSYEPIIKNKEPQKKESEVSESGQINISKLSNRLMIFALVACGIFILITIISKRIDKKKYFK